MFVLYPLGITPALLAPLGGQQLKQVMGVWLCRYLEAYKRLAGSDSHIEALSASNAAEAATTLAAVADMMLKMGEVEEATRSLSTSLDLLKQHPGQLPALQVGPCFASDTICTVLLVQSLAAVVHNPA